MPHTKKHIVVIGTQWGDEGKGKTVDWLTQHADGVVRFQGGHNAGHTLIVGQGTEQRVYKLNLIPSGIVHPHTVCLIGNGVVLDMGHLLGEIDKLEQGGIAVRERLYISPSCPLILEHHLRLDQAREQKRGVKIGTTGKGIGPAHEDKVARRALRLHDTLFPDSFTEKLRETLDYHNFVLQHYHHAEAVDFHWQLEQALRQGQALHPLLRDVSSEIYALTAQGKRLIFEGAQGSLLDIDHGTYPYVTSSNCVAGQVCAGSGVGPQLLGYVLGITKAYTTRVGGGPFPTELAIDAENTPGWQMSVIGKEIGTVTQRKRRCGWFDAVALRHAARINGLSGLCITKLDVLDGLHELNICTHYTQHGKRIDNFPLGADSLAQCKPHYETLAGWQTSTAGVKRWQDLPVNAQTYLRQLAQWCGVEIAMVSTGQSVTKPYSCMIYSTSVYSVCIM